MEFRLTYEGLLLGANGKKTRANHKHAIRRVFHAQLKRLWEANSDLRRLAFVEPKWRQKELVRMERHPGPAIDEIADRNARYGYRFLPLVKESDELLCSLEILFLRPGARGELLRSGDIDNRLKTLFDALSIPADGSGLGAPLEGESPFFVLLQDDKLITHIAVETDSLLEPVGNSENQNDARLTIAVRLRPYNSRVIKPLS